MTKRKERKRGKDGKYIKEGKKYRKYTMVLTDNEKKTINDRRKKIG